ncbi:hypothetical protein [Fodinicola acaciae]|uniref:TPR repeat region-containing protein n=1 Tax=Fodinicola acaciae TaxID=2681555 RepID=UPI0013D5144F|nr:hypothetical protein [Fodinicola acaciae]
MPSLPAPPGASPPGSLWDEVVRRLGKDPRPLDSEGSARGLEQDWNNAKDTITTDSKQINALAGQVPTAQDDGPGRILQNSMIQMVEQLDQTANQMAGRAASAGRYAGVLNSINVSIRDNIQRNQNAYDTAIASGVRGYAAARQIANVVASAIQTTLDWARTTLESDEAADPTASTIPPGGQHSAADILKRAKDGNASPQEIQTALNLLKQVNDSAADGKLDKTEMNFLDQTIGALDKDYLQLAGKLDSAPDANKILGNSLVVLGNKDLGGGLLSSGAGTQNSPQFGLPPGLSQLVTQNQVDVREDANLGTGNSTTTYSLKDEAGFRGLSTLLGASTMTGSAEFSQNLTKRTAEIAAAQLSSMKSGVGDSHSAAGLLNDRVALSKDMQNVLSASTRNHEADADLLQHDPNVLRTFAKFDWDDKGAAASGLMTWIGEDGKLPPDTAAYRLARDASIGVFDTLQDRGGYEDLFYGAKHNTELAGGLEQVARGNFSAFANGSIPDLGDPGFSPQDRIDSRTGALQIGATDANNLLSVVAAAPDKFHDLATAAGTYDAKILDDVVAGRLSPTAGALQTATLDGQLNAASGIAHRYDTSLPADSVSTNFWINSGKNLSHLFADTHIGPTDARALTKFAFAESAEIANQFGGTSASDPTQPHRTINDDQLGRVTQGAYDYLSATVRSGHYPAELAPYVRDYHGHKYLADISFIARDQSGQRLLREAAMHSSQGASYVADYSNTEFQSTQTSERPLNEVPKKPDHSWDWLNGG